MPGQHAHRLTIPHDGDVPQVAREHTLHDRADLLRLLGRLNLGLSADSRWNEILAKPGIKADFPFVAFESTYVPLSSVCVDGAMLAIADPRIDTGARVSADILRAQVQAATEAGELAIAPASPTAAATSTDQPSQIAMSFPVSVYKMTEIGFRREFLFLFDKPWPIPVCPAK